MAEAYSNTALTHWDRFTSHLKDEYPLPVADGSGISMAYVVAVSRHGAAVNIDAGTLARIDASHAALQQNLARGSVIYGVNTGFGGSANTRTSNVDDLQKTLLREFNSGVLLHGPKTIYAGPTVKLPGILRDGLFSQDLTTLNCMPVSWVRAALIVRINSLGRGVSGVRCSVVQQMARLLEHDIIPRVPMHGSISASGDLAPLSYIGSAIQGKPTSMCTVGELCGVPRIVSARDAFSEKGIQPETIVAKEALAIMNGTAFSCGLGSLVLHETHQLAILAEIATAMAVEALRGSAESFDPFFAAVRPHPGQIDAAICIAAFLKGSSMLGECHIDTNEAGVLKQDRYSVRTATQWLGPVLEDLLLSHEQVSRECNSVTDNPLIDTDTSEVARFLHGGNFQARAITSAMEKTRQGLESIGRMLFAQTSEIINPVTSNGLSPNLVLDEPSESFLFKSIDIMVAALQSELGFLANNAGSHVQTAEMGNQALNSLALISGRYTLTAVDLVAKLVAAQLLVTCQALDLRALYYTYLDDLTALMTTLASEWQSCDRGLAAKFKSAIRRSFDDTSPSNSDERFERMGRALQLTIIEAGVEPSFGSSSFMVTLKGWTERAVITMKKAWNERRATYMREPDATPYLGMASKKMYHYLRKELGVPLLSDEVLLGGSDAAQEKQDGNGNTAPTVGYFMTIVYQAVRSGEMSVPAMECLRQATATKGSGSGEMNGCLGPAV